MVKTMSKLRMAHASTHGARKPPGPKFKMRRSLLYQYVFLLVMPKYWVINYFTHGRFPEVGQKQKTEKEREKERERERAKVGENNGQATHGARKHAWPMQAAWAKNIK